VESRLLLDVVIGEGATVFQLLASKDQTLLVRRNSFLVLNLGLDVVDGVRRFHLKGDSLASHCRETRQHAACVNESGFPNMARLIRVTHKS
jgi:hypothetical protein